MNAICQKLTRLVEACVEQGRIPDAAIRAGIRFRLRQRLTELPINNPVAAAQWTKEFIQQMDKSPIAPLPHLPNQQHYEVPPAFFGEVLGPRRKYSCCHWAPGTQTLAEAEQDALRITCQRAEIEDGMTILDLGCGWGSLSLWLAEHYPESKITAVSNAPAQRAYIQSQAEQAGLNNLNCLTADMNAFSSENRFNRIVSIEMFEHMRNYRQLYRKIANWLQPEGKFFKHIFCHRSLPYTFEDKEDNDWMARHFFSGGMMPSDMLPLYFQDELELTQHWRWHGDHYVKTLQAWLKQMDDKREGIWPIFQDTYGEQSPLWWIRWRLFFLACDELFAYDGGREWWIGHYLFKKR